MKTLPWFPLDANEWMNRLAFLSLEERGALLTVVLHAWNAPMLGEAPASLPASEDALARLLGAGWRRSIGLVRQHFLEDPDDPGRLRCDWLLALFEAQKAKHESVVARAKKGGWPKGRQRGKRGDRNTSGIPGVLLSNTEGDPKGGSSGAPPLGGVVAADGRGGATSTPTPDADASRDPVPIAAADVQAWVEATPGVRLEVEAEIDKRLDEDNRGWRDRPAGAGLRNRLVEARLAEVFVRARRRGAGVVPLGSVLSSGSLPGAAHAG